ncbi:hypothetical protein E3N88_13930 [Mikania micrantha]|uniref:Translation initiation factor 5A-like N-terminal domain-containing protein n=1 Tax=Mikania micrantha TaxID=192012 RepID=A0A5N6NZX4_9ASTR|nr:hypothetical protein E3N88_13930 [Mikania micrantha]
MEASPTLQLMVFLCRGRPVVVAREPERVSWRIHEYEKEVLQANRFKFKSGSRLQIRYSLGWWVVFGVPKEETVVRGWWHDAHHEAVNPLPCLLPPLNFSPSVIAIRYCYNLHEPSEIPRPIVHSCPIGGRPIRDPAAVIPSSEFCWLLPLIQPAISVLKCPDSRKEGSQVWGSESLSGQLRSFAWPELDLKHAGDIPWLITFDYCCFVVSERDCFPYLFLDHSIISFKNKSRLGMFMESSLLARKVVEVSTSRTGKHKHAKCHLVGINIFNVKKLQDIIPSFHNYDVCLVNLTGSQSESY